jgi:hypothetical protein
LKINWLLSRVLHLMDKEITWSDCSRDGVVAAGACFDREKNMLRNGVILE